MCGICGLTSDDPRGLASLEVMRDALCHRGPDDEGIWLDPAGGVGLAHRRLSIVDLSPLGRNPMSRGRLRITYNGEIYNFRELRRELESSGETFRSSTDTEVILAAWERWGVSCLQKFVGMFAFGLWDESRRELVLVRDRLGKKPLYYAEYAGRFAFASELKALLSDPDFPRELDRDALRLYLRFGYVPAPYTIFRAARKLPPAHIGSWRPATRTLELSRYWDPLVIAAGGPARIGDEEASDKLEAILADAVRLRMIADVPLGAFLSGGIDSSLVVALMCEAASGPVKTFSMRFENAEYDEADHAAAVARHLGTEHHEETCTEAEMLGVVSTLAGHMDEPFADSSVIPTYAVSRMTRRHVTVALSGDGGDELFYGYPRYRAYESFRWLIDAPSGVRRAVASVAARASKRRVRRIADVLRQDGPAGYTRFVSWWGDAEIRRMTGEMAPPYPAYQEASTRISGLVPEARPPILDLLTYLPEDILTKVDRASMAVGLEARAPLLDHRLVEFALRLPANLKRRGGITKWLLRRALERRVPRALVDRPKMGFGVPLDDWFRGPLRESMRERLSGGELLALGLDAAPARLLWAEFEAGRSHRTDLLWSLFALIAWSERWRGASAAA